MKKKEIKDRLAEAMALRGYKQTDLVEKGGFDKGQLSSWLSGKYNPRQNNIGRLSNLLSVNEAWLMGYDVPIDLPSDDAVADAMYASLDDKYLVEISRIMEGMTERSKQRLQRYAQLLLEEQEDD